MEEEDHDHDIELVFFINPVESSLYLPKIHWSDSKESLATELHDKFSVHGLLHFVYVSKVGEKSSEEGK